MEKDSEQPFISVELDPAIGTLSFDSFKQVQDWIGEERLFWDWIGKLQHRHPAWDQAKRQVEGQFENIWRSCSQLADQGKNIPDPRASSRLAQQIKEILFTQLDGGRGIHSRSLRARLVEQVKQEDPWMALHIVYYYQFHKVNSDIPSQLEAAIRVYLFQLGVAKEASHAERKSLEMVRTEWQAFLEESKKQGSAWIRHNETVHAELEDILKEQKQKFEQTLNEGKADLAAIAKTYDKELTLLEPVNYWRKKGRQHTIRSWIYGPVTIFVALVVACCLFLEAYMLKISPTFDSATEYWKVTILLVSILFGIWIVRVLVRLLLSNIHLSFDAKERMTMISTYLAILRHPNALDEKERALVLKTVFRPAATGIVRDDAAPSLPWDALLKQTNQTGR